MMLLIGIFPAIAGLITEAKYVQPTAQLLGALLDPTRPRHSNISHL
jgi:hypothetical protein